MKRLAETWSARSASERRVATGLGIVVVATLVIVLAWLPLQRERARLDDEIPRLRATIASLERDAAEARRLRATLPATAPAPTPLASLATNAGGVAGAQITVLDERRVRLAGADVGFNAILEWIGAARTTHGMRVESARLEALGAAGRVRADVVLTRG